MAEPKNKHIDLDIEDIKPAAGPSAKVLLYILSIVLFSAIIIVGTVLVAQAIKFEPYVLYDYRTDKTEYCPLELVELEQEYEIRDEWWYSLGELEGRAFMSIDGKPYFDSQVKAQLEATPRDVYPGRAIRTAPPVPGTWKASGNGVVHGKMFGLVPVTQDLGNIESNEYTVLPWDSEDCLSVALPNLDYEQGE